MTIVTRLDADFRFGDASESLPAKSSNIVLQVHLFARA